MLVAESGTVGVAEYMKAVAILSAIQGKYIKAGYGVAEILEYHRAMYNSESYACQIMNSGLEMLNFG